MSSEMTNSAAPDDFECFENFTGSEVFVQGLAGLVNFADVEIMIRSQKQMLQRFEKTNEMLVNCNALSNSRLKNAQDEFKKITKLLIEMKQNLDYVFKKVRTIKTKLQNQYPTAFAEAKSKIVHVYEENEEEDEVLQIEKDARDVPKLIPKRKSTEQDHSQEEDTTVQYAKLENVKNDSSE